MNEHLFYIIAITIFLYFLCQQYFFQRYIYFPQTEAFTPQEVENIIQPPGSNKIGTINPEIAEIIKIPTVSNGYTQADIDNLKPSNPTAFSIKDSDNMGTFPDVEQEDYPLPTRKFEYPNRYKFTVDYPCRKTSTGMFSDCGVWSANDAWTADPYKGLNCPLSNTKTPQQSTIVSRNRGMKSNR
jgi:hypothetical protein